MEETALSADEIIITNRLSERPGRVPDHAAESRALEALAKELAEHPENLLQKLAETIVELGIGDSAGVSIEETAEVRQFRWVALAGVWSQLRGGTIPFDASPCGLAVRRDQLLLIESPQKFFAEAQVEPLIHEGLLVPFHVNGRPVGTLWINLHSPDRTFDREDARLLQSLARFASAAHQLILALRTSETGRLESDSRLRALAHASADVFYIMSADMRELRELSGGNFIPDATSPSRDWLRDYIPPEGHARALAAIRHAIQTKGVFELEHQVRRVNGEVGWAMSRAVPILGSDGEIVEWFGAANDVSARKQAEIAQRESEAKYRSLFQLIDDGYALIELLPAIQGRQSDFRFLEVNEAFERQTGNRVVAGKLGSDINPGVDAIWIEAFAEVAHSSEARRFEIHHQATGRWYNIFATPVGGDESRQVCVVFTNTTERKEREERQAFLLKLSDAIGSAKGDAIPATVCRLLVEQLGVGRSEYTDVDGPPGPETGSALGAHIRFGPPMPERWVLAELNPALVAGLRAGETHVQPDVDADPRLSAAERAQYHAVASTAAISVPLVRDGRLVAVLTVHEARRRDWTLGEIALVEEVAERTWAAVERARAERGFRESSQRLRALVTAGAQSIYRMSSDWRVMYQLDSDTLANTAAPDDRWPDKYILPDDRARVQTAIDAAIAAKSVFDLEHRVRLADGSIGWVHSRAVPLLDPEGAIVEWFGAGSDVTARKRAEEALAASEQRLSLATAASELGVWEWDLVSDRPVGNAFYYQHFDLEPNADHRGVDVIAKLHPDDIPMMLAVHEAAINPASDGHYTVEYRVLREGAGPRWLYSDGQVYFSGEGAERRPERILGTSLDITEQKLAEVALRESEARFHALFAASPVPFMVLAPNPPDFTITAANEAYFAATLTTPETLIGRRLFDVFTDNPLRPGQLGSEALAISLGKVLTTKRNDAMQRIRYDLVTPKGFEPHWWLATNAPLLDPGGNVSAIIHQVDRQTERHYAEEAEREREERQAFLLELSDTLRPLADAVEIMTAASEALGRYLKVGRCAYCEVDETGDYFTVDRDWTNGVMRSYVGRHFFGFGDQFREDYRAGKSVLIDDALADARAAGGEAAFEAAGGVRASIGIPLIKEGRFAAGFFVQQLEPRYWTAQEEELTREVAERTWAAVERARAEAALRMSEERLRQFGEASQDILWIRDATTLQWTYLTPAFETIYGLSRDDALSGDDYRNWQDLIVPEDRAHAVASIDRVLAGEQVMFEYRVQRPSDGTIRWLRNTDFPIFGGAGQVVSVGGVGHDMTDLKAVQSQIAASEERLRTLMEGIPQLVWRSCAEGRWTWASPQWLDFTGQRQGESHGLGWLNVVHSDDHAATMLAWEEAKPHGRLDVEYRIRRAADGAWLWHHTRSVPVRDADGIITEWLGTTTDVHALRELQERQEVLVAELQHRTRNLITVVRSLSDRTVGNAASLDDFKGRFGRRLAALARVQGLLSHLSAGERVDFDELLRSELTALGVADGKAEQVTLDGPSDVPLRSATVQTLALAIHELATNAVKYGALSGDAPNAHLTVRWQVGPATADDPPLLLVEWRESGVIMPQVGAPSRGSGYGRELIERALPYQLGAETTYDLSDDGVRCTIEMPIARERERAE